ncbi:MAG: phosphodiester glycosidase family protein [Eubacteriales bacterium]
MKQKKLGLGTFLCIFLIYNIVTIPPLVFYGPFPEVRQTAVGTIATSRHPQFLKFFYSAEKVRQIMRQAGIENSDNQSAGDLLAFTASSDNRIDMIQLDEGSFKGKLLKIYNPKRVEVVVTKDLFKAGEKTSDIAKRVGAVAAINGGGFNDPNGKGNGGYPQGITMHKGQVITGQDITTPQEIIGINNNGVLVIGNYTLAQLKENQVMEAITFGPQLIKAGQRMVKGNGGWGIAPRTAIGQTQDGTILLLTIDGRQVSSIGATLKEVQEIMLDYGAVNAANLDGGSSTTMFYNDKIINSPANPFGERYVPTAFVVRPAPGKGANK